MCKAVRAWQPYNHRSGTKSFLQRQVKLTELHGRPVNRVELFKETHASSSGEFISPTAEDAFESFRKVYVWLYFSYSMFLSLNNLSNLLQLAYVVQNQMVDLQSQPVPEGSEPLTQDEIYKTVFGRRLGYSKGLGWGPKPRSTTTVSSSSSSMYDYQTHSRG